MIGARCKYIFLQSSGSYKYTVRKAEYDIEYIRLYVSDIKDANRKRYILNYSLALPPGPMERKYIQSIHSFYR